VIDCDACMMMFGKKIYYCQIFIYLLTDTISLQTCVSGSICARLSTDALNVKRLVGDNLALNVQTASTIMSGFTIAMVANWKLALVITVVIPFVAFQAYAQMLFLKGLNRNAKVQPHSNAVSYLVLLTVFFIGAHS
jgi:ABC-type multidrug transport system fused ATPase/permease subunit